MTDRDNSENMAHLAALRKLQILDESDHEFFFAAMAEHLASNTPLADVGARFKISLSESASEAAALVLAISVVLNRVAARVYADGGRSSLAVDIAAAGLSEAAAEWICTTAEKAALPLAGDIRRTHAHAAAALSSSYLEDFDWQVHPRHTAPACKACCCCAAVLRDVCCPPLPSCSCSTCSRAMSSHGCASRC